MAFTLPNLPYDYNALEPVIDEQTMRIHHTKHHQWYINNLNSGLESHPDYADWSLDDLLTKIKELPDALQSIVRKHAGWHANHSLFWKIMRPSQENNAPSGEISNAINETFWNFEDFKDKFAAAWAGQFWSGWAWLVKNNDGSLQVLATPNQDSPLMNGQTPLLGLDVWEHAYYLQYQNKRADYIDARWSVVDWEKVNELYTQ